MEKKGTVRLYVAVLTMLIFALSTSLGAYAQVPEETNPEQEETSPEEIPQEETVAVPEEAESGSDRGDQLASSITDINKEIAALRRSPEFDAADVQVVRVEDVLGESEADVQRFEETVDRNNIKIWALQNVLRRQRAILDVLERSEIPLENVAAVHLTGEGEMIVFYQSSPIDSYARASISSVMRRP